jgi:hypothetical protein
LALFDLIEYQFSLALSRNPRTGMGCHRSGGINHYQGDPKGRAKVE